MFEAEPELLDYLAKLERALMAHAGSLSSRVRCHNGCSCEDAVQDVLVDVTSHLRCGTHLEGPSGRPAPTTTDALTEYAINRVAIAFRSRRAAAAYQAAIRQLRHDELAARAIDINQPPQHPEYTRLFLREFLQRLAKDANLHAEAVSMTIKEVDDFLMRRGPLQPITAKLPVVSPDNLIEFAKRRRRRIHHALEKGVAPPRMRRRPGREPVIPEPPQVDSGFIPRLTRTLMGERVDHRLAVLVVARQMIPEVIDIDPCAEAPMTEVLGCTRLQFRLALGRMMTLRREVEDFLNGPNPEGDV